MPHFHAGRSSMSLKGLVFCRSKSSTFLSFDTKVSTSLILFWRSNSPLVGISSRKLGQQNHRACRLFLRLDVSVPTNLRKIKLIFKEELEKTKVTGSDCSIWSKRFFMFSVLATNSCQNCKACFWIQLSWMLHSTWGPSSTNPFKKGRSACTCESSTAFSEAKPKWKRQIFSQEPYAKGTSTQSITGCLGAGGMYTPSMSLSLQIVSFPFSTNESLPANCVCVPMRVLWTVGIRKRYQHRCNPPSLRPVKQKQKKWSLDIKNAKQSLDQSR